MRVDATGNQPPIADSALAVEVLDLSSGASLECGADDADTILLVHSGAAEHPGGLATLVLAGERELTTAGDGGMSLVRATVGPGVDRHAAMGTRERAVSVARAESEGATGKRSFEVLFGPHNGSCRATMFVGHVPPGAAPWHFHLYDEIVWIWQGEGRFHTEAGSELLAPGSAFRIRPREIHVVENTSTTEELTVVGLFTPAGSPSAAYLAAEEDMPYEIGTA
jgi:quercetin dioxygenase-like cupin family protein